jgi:hypothetical protein
MKLPQMLRECAAGTDDGPHDPKYLMLMAARELARLESDLEYLKDDVRHCEEMSKYWEARTVTLEARLSLCGKK